jgi:hypothetical protein
MNFSYLAVPLGAFCANRVSANPQDSAGRPPAPARFAPRLPPWLRPASPWQNELTMSSRFLWALGVYAALALMAAFTLYGKLRAAVWILLGGLTVKTCIAYKAGW